VRATSAIPWLPTTSELEVEAISLAEQVAMMLHAERQVMILITGSDSGRVSGFLAELTHAVSDTDTVLRIKAAIDAQELFILLAGQLHLPVQDLTPMQLATKVGDRLREKAPNGNFVLLCEGAHNYSNTLLESIRQLSNYPMNIALTGRPKLHRRLWRPALSALKQRFNYRLDLNERKFTRAFILLMVLLVVSMAVFLAKRWIPEGAGSKTEIIRPAANRIVDAPRPIVGTPNAPPAAPSPAVNAPPAAANSSEPQETDVSLIMDPTLKHAPKP
jgi:hypothetical protein